METSLCCWRSVLLYIAVHMPSAWLGKCTVEQTSGPCTLTDVATVSMIWMHSTEYWTTPCVRLLIREGFVDFDPGEDVVRSKRNAPFSVLKPQMAQSNVKPSTKITKTPQVSQATSWTGSCTGQRRLWVKWLASMCGHARFKEAKPRYPELDIT